MEKVIRILQAEQYDTDAIEDDHDELDRNSNIRQYVQDIEYFKVVKTVLLEFGRLRTVYQFTLVKAVKFNYWNDDKSLGYPVNKKYNMLKEEILQNERYSLPLYQFNVLLHKATRYRHSIKVSSMISRSIPDFTGPSDIKSRTLISLSHLLSIVIYCGSTDLCTEFRSTFRPRYENETHEESMERNQEFANLSRLVLETITLYGMEDYTPCFCGINRPLILMDFIIDTNCPLSTTKTIEVAQRFGTYDGMVMQMVNIYKHSVRSFSTSWISDYGEENEYIFGSYGSNKINCLPRISTVIFQSTSRNYSTFIKALRKFQDSLNGSIQNASKSILKKVVFTESDMKVLDNLIKYELRQTTKRRCPKYIHDIFSSFIRNFRESDSINPSFISKPMENETKLTESLLKRMEAHNEYLRTFLMEYSFKLISFRIDQK